MWLCKIKGFHNSFLRVQYFFFVVSCHTLKCLVQYVAAYTMENKPSLHSNLYEHAILMSSVLNLLDHN